VQHSMPVTVIDQEKEKDKYFASFAKFNSA
jgi:hypothetical protein